MKKIIIHSVPLVISFIWLATECQTLNPIALKGPDFLKFYLILILGFYTSVFILKLFKESVSRTVFFLLILIFSLGVVKLIRGIILGKPIGFLSIILLVECIVGVLLISNHFKDNIN